MALAKYAEDISNKRIENLDGLNDSPPHPTILASRARPVVKGKRRNSSKKKVIAKKINNTALEGNLSRRLAYQAEEIRRLQIANKKLEKDLAALKETALEFKRRYEDLELKVRRDGRPILKVR